MVPQGVSYYCLLVVFGRTVGIVSGVVIDCVESCCDGLGCVVGVVFCDVVSTTFGVVFSS